MKRTIRDELRDRELARAKRADSGSRRSAIELFCMECCGGSSAYEAIRCEIRECFLWPHAFGRGKREGEVRR